MTWDLEYWSSEEWYRAQEKLDDLERRGVVLCPVRRNLSAAIDELPLSSVRVAIFGQDPYPNPDYATGIAFSIPTESRTFPPTLCNIYNEYVRDLRYPFPTTGCLSRWVEQGVLLWNVTPIYYRTVPPGLNNWAEWQPINKEIVTLLSDQNCIFWFMGARARAYAKYVDLAKMNYVIETSHPSPLGQHHGSPRKEENAEFHPFFGCRAFSTINSKLSEPIDWRLP